VKQRLLIAIFTVLVFGAGFAARVWTDEDRALPPPPSAPGGEFVRVPTAPAANAKAEPKRGADRAKMIADIERLRPQIDAYRNRLEVIEAEFQRDFVPVLNPEQREHYDAFKKKGSEDHAKNEAKAAADTTLLTDEQVERLRQRPLWNALDSVAISWPLDRLKDRYKLDEAQQAKVRELLRMRREKFIALVDSTPPPSITLSDLARRTQKLVPSAKADK
jgi:hypothetical protein